ncbi:MAG: phosphoribosylformylglycinamidine synthase subunit PurS [Salibacteraceae bacterium]
MKFVAEIDIMPHDNLLDPQGKAVASSMKNLGLSSVKDVRIGKHIRLELEADNRQAAEAIVDEACKRLLCNQIVETYRFELSEPLPA